MRERFTNDLCFEVDENASRSVISRVSYLVNYLKALFAVHSHGGRGDYQIFVPEEVSIVIGTQVQECGASSRTAGMPICTTIEPISCSRVSGILPVCSWFEKPIGLIQSSIRVTPLPIFNGSIGIADFEHDGVGEVFLVSRCCVPDNSSWARYRGSREPIFTRISEFETRSRVRTARSNRSIGVLRRVSNWPGDGWNWKLSSDRRRIIPETPVAHVRISASLASSRA